MATVPLLLLKSESRPYDPYRIYFTAHPFKPPNGDPIVPFDPIYIPALHHHYTNSAALEALIVSGKLDPSADDHCYSALIVTSQRAVEALGAVLAQLQGDHAQIAPLLTHTRVYVVGPATAKSVKLLGFTTANVLGADCGSGEALAEFILADAPPDRPLLFLVGETRRDIIPRTLGAAGVRVEELVVYETDVAESFREEFRSAVQRTEGARRWIVIFSPASADVAVGVLREHRESGESGSYVAAIGPTTEKCLSDTLGRRPEVVAGKPSPQGLWEAVTAFMTAGEWA